MADLRHFKQQLKSQTSGERDHLTEARVVAGAATKPWKVEWLGINTEDGRQKSAASSWWNKASANRESGTFPMFLALGEKEA
jgi:hypothetical protein